MENLNNNQSHLIILNGTSSAGKSSIAQSLQKNADIYFLHFQIDMFWAMLPPQENNEPREFPTRKYALMNAAKGFLEEGFNLVFDTVTIGRKNVDDMRDVFTHFAPFIVGVKAELNDINQREKQRGDRDIGIAAKQYPDIHTDVIYDFEVNTSVLSPDQAADQILVAYHSQRILG